MATETVLFNTSVKDFLKHNQIPFIEQNGVINITGDDHLNMLYTIFKNNKLDAIQYLVDSDSYSGNKGFIKLVLANGSLEIVQSIFASIDKIIPDMSTWSRDNRDQFHYDCLMKICHRTDDNADILKIYLDKFGCDKYYTIIGKWCESCDNSNMLSLINKFLDDY
jgi:F0F1-type ATP synthase delta subunit